MDQHLHDFTILARIPNCNECPGIWVNEYIDTLIICKCKAFEQKIILNILKRLQSPLPNVAE